MDGNVTGGGSLGMHFRADIGRGQVPVAHLMKIKALPIKPAMWARSMANAGKVKPAVPVVIDQLLMSAAQAIGRSCRQAP